MQDAVFSGHIGICLPATGHGTFFAIYILSDKKSGGTLVPLRQVQATNRQIAGQEASRQMILVEKIKVNRRIGCPAIGASNMRV
jgi:hypothetical protein